MTRHLWQSAAVLYRTGRDCPISFLIRSIPLLLVVQVSGCLQYSLWSMTSPGSCLVASQCDRMCISCSPYFEELDFSSGGDYWVSPDLFPASIKQPMQVPYAWLDHVTIRDVCTWLWQRFQVKVGVSVGKKTCYLNWDWDLIYEIPGTTPTIWGNPYYHLVLREMRNILSIWILTGLYWSE